jgi:hypothetical protein
MIWRQLKELYANTSNIGRVIALQVHTLAKAIYSMAKTYSIRYCSDNLIDSDVPYFVKGNALQLTFVSIFCKKRPDSIITCFEKRSTGNCCYVWFSVTLNHQISSPWFDFVVQKYSFKSSIHWHWLGHITTRICCDSIWCETIWQCTHTN